MSYLEVLKEFLIDVAGEGAGGLTWRTNSQNIFLESLISSAHVMILLRHVGRVI